MRLDKRSETSKWLGRLMRRLAVLVVVIGVGGGVVWYLVHSGVISLDVTEDQLNGKYGWFFKIVETQGWGSAGALLGILLFGIVSFYLKAEQDRARDQLVRELNQAGQSRERR